MRLEEPPLLEVTESLVEPSFAPLVVGELPHDVLVPRLVDDEAEGRAAVHDHHREFGSAALDAMHVGELGPLVLPEQRVEPGQRHDGIPDGDPLPPRSTVARLVQHAHHRIAVATLLVHVRRIQGKGEVMNLLGAKTDAFAPRCHLPALMRGAWCVVPVALIIDSECGVDLRCFPARVAFHRDARGADHLVLGELEHDVVRGELAVELAPGIERVVLPTVAVVHHDLGIPLREIEAPAPAPLAPRQRGKARQPIDVDRERIAGDEGARQRPVGDGRVGGVGVIGPERLTHHGGAGDALEGVVRVLQVLKPLALLGRVGRGPAGAGAEGVQILVDVEIAQRVGGAVHIADAHVAGEHARRLVQRCGDLIRDLLLPVGGRVAGDEQKNEGEHGGGEATAARWRWGGGLWRRPARARSLSL